MYWGRNYWSLFTGAEDPNPWHSVIFLAKYTFPSRSTFPETVLICIFLSTLMSYRSSFFKHLQSSFGRIRFLSFERRDPAPFFWMLGSDTDPFKNRMDFHSSFSDKNYLANISGADKTAPRKLNVQPLLFFTRARSSNFNAWVVFRVAFIRLDKKISILSYPHPTY